MEGLRGCVVTLNPHFPSVLTPSQRNILVDAAGHARITDFSLATIIQDPNSPTSTPEDHDYTRWTAPEILRFGSPATKESDIFAFGMVTIEVGCSQPVICQPSDLLKVFTGKVPFDEKGAPAVIWCIMNGKRPNWPNHPDFTEKLWTLLQQCWEQEAKHRPQTQEVMEVLNGPSAFILHLDYECSTQT